MNYADTDFTSFMPPQGVTNDEETKVINEFSMANPSAKQDGMLSIYPWLNDFGNKFEEWAVYDR